MQLIEWRADFCTGIESIDYEHEELIKLINALFEKAEEKKDKQNIVESLNEIYAEIAGHFVLEENIMKNDGYDQYEVHRQDHAKLLDEIGDITEAYESDQDIPRLQQVLNDWFINHFKTHDARLHSIGK
ncbi:MAG: bacteriohemerythrin [Gammaproteobacteria bacterium]|nr:bacteriohemerythrin [Gammaproteobacteria bacterium]MDH5735305.1 bacteriohemerythrin [Gammaproteobacteria bacterium]